jgi:hypothetical protein
LEGFQTMGYGLLPHIGAMNAAGDARTWLSW